MQTEALLFGQAGMLRANFNDDYPRVLWKEYRFLADKYKLTPLQESAWKFLRLRPTNFPTLRISQFGSFLKLTQGRFFRMIDSGTFNDAVAFLDISATEYWNTHYMFDKSSVFRTKILGRSSANLIIINGLVPFIFFYGLEKDQPSIREKALNFLEQLQGESNAEITKWDNAGLPCCNAMHTQALLHLKRFYCEKKQCLDCRIGSVLLAADR
jgi:hypothetical protein